MSEYQYIYFAAINRPLDDKQLDFMRAQSTRAEVTPWQFQNEYHYGDFRGDASEMLRRGYDVHLHYANFGIRKLMFRLPTGLPLSVKQFNSYAIEYSIEWEKDKRGKGGVLTIHPECDAGDYRQEYFDFQRLINCLPRIHDGLISGDTRLLYLSWLACNMDDQTIEPPVPAGLQSLPPEFSQLIDFYEVDPFIVAAASQQSPKLSGNTNHGPEVDDWLTDQSPETLRLMMRRVLNGDAAAVRTESLAAIRSLSKQLPWPTNTGTRSLEEIRELASVKAEQSEKRELAREKRNRNKRLAEIRENPAAVVSEAAELIKSRTTENYTKAAKMLAQIREAINGDEGNRIAEKAAKKFAKKHPTLRHLKRAFKQEGLNYR